MKTFIATKDELIAMNTTAEINGYNRHVDEDVLLKQPDNLTAVCVLHMPHEHAAGVKVEPHIRALWMVFDPDTLDPKHPIQITIDCDWDLFMALTQIDTATTSETEDEDLGHATYTDEDGTLRYITTDAAV
jgi:hypothetical protein